MHGGDESSAVGSRLVRVQCDKCGCEYFYELARVGSGQAHAPYAIGTRIAARRAEERAQRDLAKRLENDAELVPCPKCAWINAELVSRYRRGRYRGWATFAACTACLGTSIALVCAWFLSIGPRRTARRRAVLAGSGSDDLDCRRSARAASPHLAQEPNPAKSGLSAAPKTATRRAKCIAGGPNERSARPCSSAGHARARDWPMDRLPGRQTGASFTLLCLSRSTGTPGRRADIQCSEAAVLLVPFCSRCAHEWKLRVWLVGLIAFGAVGRTCVRGAAALKLDPLAFWVSFVLVCGATPLLAAGVAYRLTTPVRVKSADASRALARLWFRSEPYRNHVSRVALARG